MTSPKPIIHVVDDDASFRHAVSRLVRAGGHQVRCYASAAEFLAAAPDPSPGCVLLDLHMPGPTGLDLQDALAKAENPLPVIFLTGHGDIPTSVHAMRQGAEDFLTKPVKKELLFAALRGRWPARRKSVHNALVSANYARVLTRSRPASAKCLPTSCVDN